jgi:hypothetical protein
VAAILAFLVLGIRKVVLAVPVLSLDDLAVFDGHNLQFGITGLVHLAVDDDGGGRSSRLVNNSRSLGPANNHLLAHLVGQVEASVPAGAFEGELLEAIGVEPAELYGSKS